jgi:poly(hydroxyalkanoate) depolymerase family esterase
MALVDWRELYAANRAAIERQLPARARLADGEPWPQPGHLVPASGHRLRRSAPPRAPAAGALAYVVHKPTGLPPNTAAPLVMLLHGCTQDAPSIAAGTRMNDLADRYGFVVVYPQQARRANPQGCWNWFGAGHQARDAGEPALLAQVVRNVLGEADQWSIDPARMFVAGMSAGGAMASIMAATYPDLFAAVAVHSGLAFGVATSQATALAAMSGSGQEPIRLGELAVRAMSSRARPVPAIVVHGGRDRVVAPVNGDRVVQQWMVTNRLTASGDYEAEFEHPTSVERGRAPGGHHYSCSRWLDRHGRPMQEYLRVDELGHAWSGGAAGASYTDPHGPNASELIWRFFQAVSD